MLEQPLAAWRRLSFEQRVAGAGAILLLISTFGPFSWIEAAIALIGVALLFLLFQRGVGKTFRLPAADGTLIALAGAWAGLLIAIRLFDRPLGQNLLALACAAILVLAGARERSHESPPTLVKPTEPLSREQNR
jgi:hypothetical protein